MGFVLFMALVYAAAVFHRFEHRLMQRELAALAARWPSGAALPPDADWRITGGTAERPQLRRAFRITGRAALWRYALPVVFTSMMMIVLQDFTLAGIYAAICAVKWFATDVRLTRGAAGSAGYAVHLGRLRLFGEALQSPP